MVTDLALHKKRSIRHVTKSLVVVEVVYAIVHSHDGPAVCDRSDQGDMQGRLQPSVVRTHRDSQALVGQTPHYMGGGRMQNVDSTGLIDEWKVACRRSRMVQGGRQIRPCLHTICGSREMFFYVMCYSSLIAFEYPADRTLHRGRREDYRLRLCVRNVFGPGSGFGLGQKIEQRTWWW